MPENQSDPRGVGNQNGQASAQRGPAAAKNLVAGKNAGGAKNMTAGSAATDPIALLRADHRRVEELFAAFEKASDPREKQRLADEACTEFVIHSMIEEEIFYPACQGRVDKKLLDEAQVEHDGAKTLVIEIQHGSPEDSFYDAKVKLLAEQIKHHVQEEEKPREGIFAKAKETGVPSEDLATQLAERKQELMAQAKAEALGPPETRSFRAQKHAGTYQPRKESQMARGSSGTMERERDERGRFMSDDDDRDYRRSSRYDDDDRRTYRARDDEGRFTSSRSRSRYDDDDDGRGYGRGGWFGDPEGHSRASREGWDNPRHGRSGWYGDTEGHSEASREGWDHPRRGRSGWYGDPEAHSEASREGWDHPRRGRSGWYGDSEGHSEASREGWDHPRHGRSGWYGDPEGHSRASREGWDDRDRGGYRSRSRYDDDDDYRRGGGRGHGGWYGDPEGHSRASREGWDDRGSSRTRSRYRDDD